MIDVNALAPGDLAALRQLGVEKALVSPLEPCLKKVSAERVAKLNAQVLKLAEKEDWLIPAAVAIPGTSPERLQMFGALRLCPAIHGYLLDSNWARKAVGLAEEADVPVLIQVRLGWDSAAYKRLGDVSSLAREYRHTPIVVSGLNYAETLAIAQNLAGQDNIYVEISHFQPLDGLRLLVKLLGVGRVLAGTGYPLLYPHSTMLKLEYSGLTRVEVEAIAWRNAAAILKKL